MAHDPVFSGAITAALPRARIKLDGEGWPFVPARYGRIEWRGLGRPSFDRRPAPDGRPAHGAAW
jgi:hypothetical protein